MALKINKRCKICLRILDEPSFQTRLANSRAYVPGGESLLSIAASSGMQYKALIRHTSKHQGISNYELKVRTARQSSRDEGSKIVKGALKAQTARQTVLDQLAQILEDAGALELGKDITAKDAIGLLLKATKDSDDVDAKRKDQDIDVFKLMTGARSGNTPALPATTDDKPFDPWVKKDLEEGEIIE